MLSIKNSLIFVTLLGLSYAATLNDNSEKLMESMTESNEFLKSNESSEFQESFVSLQPPPRNCVVGCPRILDPICAIDETDAETYKYFHNQCLMEYDSCRQSKAWKPTQMILCIADIDPLLRADCMRVCPFIYNPVCASDGEHYEIFGNPCIFGIENCLVSGKWFVERSEQCGL